MLFNSFEYIFFFLPLSVVLFFLFNRFRLTLAAKSLLVFFSLVFYGWWKFSYLPIILVSVIFNFFIGSILSAGVRRPAPGWVLAAGVSGNLLALGYYKYAAFAVENINALSGAAYAVPAIVLPLGISFFTFTQIAYLVDCRQGKVKERDFMNYLLFVTYFPHLLAGPILHHKEMMPQFDRLRNKVMNWRHLYTGLMLFTLGLFKKIIIADNLARYANPWIDAPAAADCLLAWAASVSYTMQLYFDFSGYTDMAIGSALMINIKLPQNFNSPYKALDIQDFWRRWHMTLSRFLRDYVYIPLGGNRGGELPTYANLFITFFLGGVWHGAGWTFVAWGALHGGAVVAHRAWKNAGMALPRAAAWLLTFLFVNAAWVFFRAATVENALTMLRKMFLPAAADFAGFAPLVQNHRMALFALVSGALALFALNSWELAQRLKPRAALSLLAAAIAAVTVLHLGRSSAFLYFNF